MTGREKLYRNAPEDDEKTVIRILWAIDPKDGNGRTVYDELFSELKRIHGRPKRTVDNKDVDSITGIHDEAGSWWEYDKYSVSCSYIEYKESGRCQVMYKIRAKANAL